VFLTTPDYTHTILFSNGDLRESTYVLSIRVVNRIKEYEVATVKDRYIDVAMQMVKNSIRSGTVTKDVVYQEGNVKNRELVYKIIDDLIKPESRFENFEALRDLSRLSLEGKACLVVMEHYSNFDIPTLHYLMRKEGPEGDRIFEQIISIAGKKLNMDSDFVRAFTESYTRIVVYPTRGLASIKDPVQLEEETKRSREVNRAALREMIRHKYNGRMILLFPWGTRYRPGQEDTKRALKETDTYMKSFDYMVFVGTAGNLLLVNPGSDMTADELNNDVMIFACSEITDCRAFREKIRREASSVAEEDLKQLAADQVNRELERMHQVAEQIRSRYVSDEQVSR
jgi:glycerol-3-phosphate O-acyltransferase